MKPIIYPATEKNFKSNGYGTLAGAYSCKVTEELNGSYELEMQVPKGSLHSEYLQVRNIIACSSNATKKRQCFRIYDLKSDIGKAITVYARHLSYDLSDYPVLPYNASGAQAAVNGLKTHQPAGISVPFAISTELTAAGSFKVTVPTSIRSTFADKEGCLLNVFGGEWSFDNFECVLKKKRGSGSADSPVARIAYGRNLNKYDKETDSDSQYTAIIATWKKEKDGATSVAYSDPVSTGVEGYTRVGYTDVSSDFEEQPTTAELNTAAQDYIDSQNLSKITTSISVDWIQINNAIISLGDYVRVWHEDEYMTSRVIKTVWDALADRYDSLQLGDKKANIVDAIKSAASSEKESKVGELRTGTRTDVASVGAAWALVNSITLPAGCWLITSAVAFNNGGNSTYRTAYIGTQADASVSNDNIAGMSQIAAINGAVTVIKTDRLVDKAGTYNLYVRAGSEGTGVRYSHMQAVRYS